MYVFLDVTYVIITIIIYLNTILYDTVSVAAHNFQCFDYFQRFSTLPAWLAQH